MIPPESGHRPLYAPATNSSPLARIQGTTIDVTSIRNVFMAHIHGPAPFGANAPPRSRGRGQQGCRPQAARVLEREART